MNRNLRLSLIYILICSFSSIKTFAQEDPSLFLFHLENRHLNHFDNSLINENKNSISFKWHDPITQLPTDFLSFGKKTFNIKSINTIAGLTLLTGILISVDHETIEPFRSNYKSSPTIRNLSKDISWLGGGEFHLILASAFGSAGLILDDQRALRTALQIVEAELVTGVTVQLLKRVAGRESPQSATHFHGLFRPFPNLKDYHQNETKYYSFPSGHVSTSVAVLTVIAENYTHVSWIKPVGYATIGLIGIGLVARGWHWFSDYPLAAVIGYTFGKIISSRNDLLNDDDFENSHWSIHPDYKNGLGIGLSYKLN